MNERTMKAAVVDALLIDRAFRRLVCELGQRGGTVHVLKRKVRGEINKFIYLGCKVFIG